tara:strand:- start:144 stop:605 length:462 start_codon:yes stop_codon:yes gene_type:complete
MLAPISQRLIAILIYMLPWSDALNFGRYLFIDFPYLKLIAIPALPIIIFQQIIPFGSLILFLLLFLIIIRNPKISYFLRFNSLQSILINIVIILINYTFQLIIQPLGNSLLVTTLSSTVIVSVLLIIIFCIYECINGREPDLPVITEAVKIQL